MADITPFVSRLFIHPIKALDRVEMRQVTVLKSGALSRDRELAIFDQGNQFVNGKRNKRVHTLRSQFDLETNHVTLSIQGVAQTVTFHVEQEQEALEAWLGQYFGFPVTIQQNRDLGFPDDTVSPGPTIISTATLAAIAAWYPGLEVEEVRLRLRSNIEIDGVPAFWEDQLFSAAEQTVAFQIGPIQFMGVNPCQRCVVITRNSQTGAADLNFQKIFATKRQETLPDWTERSRFNHFYRIAVNTRLYASEQSKVIQIGDTLKIR